MPDAIAATSSAGATPITTDTPTVDPSLLNRSNGFDQDMFLQLLVAQLKYQNPLEPMDSSEFMGQSAQFTTVEKLEELTEGIAATLNNDRLGTATGMIGRDVTYTAPDGQTVRAGVQGVRVEVTGPVLVLDDGLEIAMSDVRTVSTPL